MAWLKKDLSFAQIVSKKANGFDSDIGKYERTEHETDIQHAQRLKKILHSTKSILTEFPVYKLSKKNKSMNVAARNEVVAKFLATQSYVPENKSVSESQYVDTILSDVDAAYSIGIDEDMPLDEATHYAREHYRSQHRKQSARHDSMWLTATVSKVPNRVHYKEEILKH